MRRERFSSDWVVFDEDGPCVERASNWELESSTECRYQPGRLLKASIAFFDDASLAISVSDLLLREG
jgi:hypothetical protein